MTAIIPLIAAAIGAATTLSSSGNQQDAINGASTAQTASQQAAIDEQRREFGINQANLSPYLSAGQTALDAQLKLLGLGGLHGFNSATGTVTPAPGSPGASAPPALSTNNSTPDWNAYVQNNPDILDAYNAGDGKGATMADFGKWHWQTFGQNEYNTGDTNRVYTPFGPAQYTTNTGGQTVPSTSPSVTQPGSTAPATPMSQADMNAAQQAAIDQLKNSPLYQSIYGNGVNTILANASATGGLRGGNVQDSLARFGGDALSQVIQNQLANLGGIAGNGQNAGGTIGSLNSGTGANIGSLLTQMGATQGGGILGSAAVGNNGLNSALSQIFSGLGQSYSGGLGNVLKGLFGGGGNTMGSTQQVLI